VDTADSGVPKTAGGGVRGSAIRWHINEV